MRHDVNVTEDAEIGCVNPPCWDGQLERFIQMLTRNYCTQTVDLHNFFLLCRALCNKDSIKFHRITDI